MSTPDDDHILRFTINDQLGALAHRFGAELPGGVLDDLAHHVADVFQQYQPGSNVLQFTGADGSTHAEADDTPTTFTLESVLDVLEARHPEVIAFIENTGGGVMCLLAAPREEAHPTRPATAPGYGGTEWVWPVIAGPARVEAHGHVADLRDFTVGLEENLDWQPPTDSMMAAGWTAQPGADTVGNVAAAVAVLVAEFHALYTADTHPTPAASPASDS